MHTDRPPSVNEEDNLINLEAEECPEDPSGTYKPSYNLCLIDCVQ